MEKNRIINYIKIKYKIILTSLITIFMFLWVFPVHSNGLADVMAKDGPSGASWKIGLNWATELGLKFGKDIVFQYGPLYFLSNNSLVNISRPFYFAANIFYMLLFIAAIFLFIRFFIERLDFTSLKNKIFSHLLVLLISYAFLNIYIEVPELLLLLSLLLMFDLIEKNYSRKINYLYAIFIGFIFSVISLVEFYFFVASLVLIILSIIVFSVVRKPHIAFSLFGSFITFFILIWLTLEKSLYFLLLYIRNGFALWLGYSEGMQVFFEGWQNEFLLEGKFVVLFALLIFILWTVFLIFGIKKKKKNIIYYFLLSFPILFLVFKQGFVRMDLFHTQQYFRFIIFLLIFTLLIFGRRFKKIIPVFLILIIIAIPFRTANESLSIRIRALFNVNEVNRVSRIINPVTYNEMQLNEKNETRKTFADYKDIINLIGKNDTVDIIPWEVVVPYAYDLKWSPRPIFQSAAVYNPLLNKLNADHFKGAEAPDKVIYSIGSTDGKYSLFDEPLVFQELLKNYSFSYLNNKGIGLLQKKTKAADFEIETIKKINAGFNEAINITDVSNGYLFCKLNIDLNPLGTVKNLLYKGDYTYIKFYFDNPDKEPVTFRLIRENAKLGIFVSNYVDSLDTLKNIFSQQSQNYYKIDNNKIKSIEILNSSSATFEKDFEVEFFIMKFDEISRVNIF